MNPDVELLEMKDRSDMKSSRVNGTVVDGSGTAISSGPSMDGQWTAQDSVGKESTGKDSSGECSAASVAVAQLGSETLTQDIYMAIVKDYCKEDVDMVIHRILEHPYMNCLNERTIRKWCEEQKKYQTQSNQKKNKFNNYDQRRYDYDELERKLFKV